MLTRQQQSRCELCGAVTVPGYRICKPCGDRVVCIERMVREGKYSDFPHGRSHKNLVVTVEDQRSRRYE